MGRVWAGVWGCIKEEIGHKRHRPPGPPVSRGLLGPLSHLHLPLPKAPSPKEHSEQVPHFLCGETGSPALEGPLTDSQGSTNSP